MVRGGLIAFSYMAPLSVPFLPFRSAICAPRGRAALPAHPSPERPEIPAEIRIVVNWFEELRRLAAGWTCLTS